MILKLPLTRLMIISVERETFFEYQRNKILLRAVEEN
jgi:hypothetical protein